MSVYSFRAESDGRVNTVDHLPPEEAAEWLWKIVREAAADGSLVRIQLDVLLGSTHLRILPEGTS